MEYIKKYQYEIIGAMVYFIAGMLIANMVSPVLKTDAVTKIIMLCFWLISCAMLGIALGKTLNLEPSKTKIRLLILFALLFFLSIIWPFLLFYFSVFLSLLNIGILFLASVILLIVARSVTILLFTVPYLLFLFFALYLNVIFLIIH